MPQHQLPGSRLTPLLTPLVGCVCGLGGAASGAGTAPDQIHLTCQIRDFLRSHPDFDTMPTAGYGHDAGNLSTSIDLCGDPVFTGGGFRVDTEWTDAAGNPIAPHLFGGWGAGALLVSAAPTISPSATFDTWDSALGPYGGGNTGPMPDVAVGATMPVITPPTGFGPSVGALEYEGIGTTVLTGDLHCDSLSIRGSHTVQIDGAVRILCDGSFEARDDVSIELLPGATLEIYVSGDILIQDATIDEGFHAPGRLTIYHLGAGAFRIADGAEVYAAIVAPFSTLTLADDSNLYCAFAGADLTVDDTAGMHLDATSAFDQCGNRLNDTAGLAGVASDGAITSSASFDEWFRDTPGANVSIPHMLTLSRGTDGIYEYLSDSFHPVDDRLFGNEGESHNNNFTVTIAASFVYDACAGQFLEFEGNDDVWMYVDGTLAMDLGGILPGTSQHAAIDRLGLVDGRTYPLLFFLAQRQGAQSVFRLRTNIELTNAPWSSSISAMFD